MNENWSIDYDSLLRYLEVTEEGLLEKGIPKDELVDYVYEKGIEKFEKEGYEIKKDNDYWEAIYVEKE